MAPPEAGAGVIGKFQRPGTPGGGTLISHGGQRDVRDIAYYCLGNTVRGSAGGGVLGRF